ncbi:hypothetical protein FQ087_12100 [Sporosarcina sp. ANT_H38]|uniref:hypothetical protein n=1 Tax=Sporosarcina sp. ANT_H38 TaxID=2597358 RepID=UPI0011F17CFB|nr:hypothetical protein [Sporosarcina sp. ANT_H38]KAA0966920.1 hypothetical protein FQ087_12100 [Sporosarcina sp. ANT_H38]
MICEIQQMFKKDWENYIRFDLNSNNPYVYDCYFPESNEMPFETLSVWMENIKAFPIYFCVQVTEGFLEVFDEKVTQHQIRKCFTQRFEGDCNVVILEVQNSKEFSGIFPLLQVISGMDDIVLWSTKKNCFFIGDTMKGKGWFSDIPGLVNLEDGITVYSLPHAGTILRIFSEDINFSTFEKVCSLLPLNIRPIQDNE